MTNYFLMSLAVADLLVCMIVMPFGAIVFFKGQYQENIFILTKIGLNIYRFPDNYIS